MEEVRGKYGLLQSRALIQQLIVNDTGASISKYFIEKKT